MIAARASFGCVSHCGQRIADPREVRRAAPPEEGVDRPVERVEEPEPEEPVGDVGDDRRERARRAVGTDTREPAVQEEREGERSRKAERHRDRGEDERVRDRDPEYVVVEELSEVVEPDEVRAPVRGRTP